VTARFSVIAIRLVVLVGVWLLGTSTLSLAQENAVDPSVIGEQAAEVQPAAEEEILPLVVPDVRGLPYVFAKGILDDAGFAWKVSGDVDGFATNVVATQSAKPGTKVVDNGAPTLVLTLETNPAYEEIGLPSDESPYAGTKLVLVSGASPKPAEVEDEPVSDDLTEATEAGDEPYAETDTESAAAEPGETTETEPATETTEPEPAAETTDVDVTLDADVAVEADNSTARPPAFVVAGAPKEPLDEIPLPRRATQLGSWLKNVKKLTPASVDHFAYQHAWVLTGASFGWWHGAEALRTLIQVDQELERKFGGGDQYEAEARTALREVLRKSKGT
jgi:hypothetical protein